MMGFLCRSTSYGARTSVRCVNESRNEAVWAFALSPCIGNRTRPLRGLKSNAFKDWPVPDPDDLGAYGRGMSAARCRCDASSLLRHGWGEGGVKGTYCPASWTEGTAAASCPQSTGLSAVTPWKQGRPVQGFEPAKLMPRSLPILKGIGLKSALRKNASYPPKMPIRIRPSPAAAVSFPSMPTSPACLGCNLDKQFSQESNWGTGIFGTRRCAMKPR